VRPDIKRGQRLLHFLIFATMLPLSSCGSSTRDLSLTQTVNAVVTAAHQTFEVQAATQLASSLPTETPPPTLTPSPVDTASSSPTAVAVSGQGACDNNVWIGDVTIPDGTVLAANAKFVKTWLLQNTGTCAWSTGYSLFFSSGDQMGGADTLLPATVPAGSQAEISTALTAPAESGNYTGWWRMKNAQGQPFGKVITVVIQVGSSAGCRHPARFGSVTIAGHAGPEKVTIDYGDGTVFTDPHGDYSFSVPTGWSGVVRPWKAKVHPWTFDPEQRFYSSVVCDMLDEDYKATAPPGS
jgi:hypothetical protein